MSKRGISTLRAVLVAGGVSVAVAAFASPAMAEDGIAVRVAPSTVKAGEAFTFGVSCSQSGTKLDATVSLTVIGGPSELTLPQGSDGEYVATVKVPKTVKPGKYKLNAQCSAGQTGSGTLTVVPSGVIKTGGGATSAGVNQGLVAGGAGLVAVAALGGAVLVRRRKADGSI